MRLKSKFEAWAGIIVGGRECRSAIAELEKTREHIREGDMRHFFLDRIKKHTLRAVYNRWRGRHRKAAYHVQRARFYIRSIDTFSLN